MDMEALLLIEQDSSFFRRNQVFLTQQTRWRSRTMLPINTIIFTMIWPKKDILAAVTKKAPHVIYQQEYVLLETVKYMVQQTYTNMRIIYSKLLTEEIPLFEQFLKNEKCRKATRSMRLEELISEAHNLLKIKYC